MEEAIEEIKNSTEKKEIENIEKRKSKLKNFFFGWIKDNYDKIFLGILVLAFIIRIWIFFRTLNQPIWWDGADYMATAKRLGLNLKILDIWYYRRGFLFPLIGALFFKLGLGEIGMRFLIILLSTGIVAVSYFLIKEMFNKKIALFVSLGVALSWIMLFFSGRILTDLPAAFLILLSLLFFWKGYVLKQGNKFLYLFGLFFGLTILTRMQMFMFAPAFLVIILLKEKFKFLKNKHLWITLGIILLILSPQIVLYSQHFGNPITDIMSYYLGINIGSTATNEIHEITTYKMFDYIKDLPYIMNSPIFYLFIIGLLFFIFDLIIGIDKIFSNEEIQKKFFMLVWIIISFLFLGYITDYVEHRYILACMPFLFLITIYPLSFIEKLLSKKTKISKKSASIILLLVFIGLMIPNFIFGNNLIDQKKDSYIEVKQSGEWIKENSNPSDIIISASLPQTTYYSERSTYPFDLSYRRDIKGGNESDFDNFIQEQKPRYIIISRFEQNADWVYAYPQKHNDTLTPVKIYSQSNQPILIIYKFNYN